MPGTSNWRMLYVALGVSAYSIPTVLMHPLARGWGGEWPAVFPTVESWVFYAQLCLMPFAAYMCSLAAVTAPGRLALSLPPLALNIAAATTYEPASAVEVLTLLLQAPLALLPVLVANAVAQGRSRG